MSEEGVRQLKAIMFTDIKGFSSMMGKDEELTVRLVREHRELIREVLAKHRGEERQTIGDAFLVLFDSAVNAVRCAVEIQTRMRAINAERPEQERIWIRIGIHLGDILVEEKEIYGDGVNIAARVEPQAEPGGICITQQVLHQIEGKLDCRTSHLGRRELKNIRNAPDLYQLIIDQAGEGKAGTSASSSDTAWPRPPWWKVALWWLLTASLPVALGLLSFTPLGRTLWSNSVGEAPVLVALAALLVPAGQLVAAYFVFRFWTRGAFNPWLQGRYFVVFPVGGALLFLYHYVVLQGRVEAAVLPVRTYAAIPPPLADEIRTNLAVAITRYGNSYALDGLIVAYFALLVLLGYLFLPRSLGKPVFSRRHWLVLAAGLAVVVSAEVLFAQVMREAGFAHITMLGGWFLVAAAMLRAARADGRPHSCGARALGVGLVLIAALTGTMAITGFLSMFGKLAGRFTADMVPVVWSAAMAEIGHGYVATCLLMAVLLAMLVIVLRKGLVLERTTSRREVAVEVGSMTVTLAASLLPLATFPSVMSTLRTTLTLPAKGMVPAAREPGANPSFYVDPRPTSVGTYGQRLYMALSGKRFWDEYRVELLLGALSAGTDCADSIVASLGDAAESNLSPTLCLTAVEARLACEVQGKRLATPEEWQSAVGPVPITPLPGADAPRGGLARLPLGEWTMRIVHGSPVFEVHGADAGPDIPGNLAPAGSSPKVGFRCAYTYEP